MRNISDLLNEKVANQERRIAEKTISAHLDKLGFKEFRMRDQTASYIQITPELFETIIGSICPTFSTYSTYSPYYKEKKEKNNVEGMVNDGEEEKNNKMVNMVINGENGDTSMQGILTTKNPKTHGKNSVENNKPHETKGACEELFVCPSCKKSKPKDAFREYGHALYCSKCLEDAQIEK